MPQLWHAGRRNGRERHLDRADAATAKIVHSYTQEVLALGRRVNTLMEFQAAPPPRLMSRWQPDFCHFPDRVYQLAVRVVQQDLKLKRSVMNAVGCGCKRDILEVGTIPDGVVPVGRPHFLFLN